MTRLLLPLLLAASAALAQAPQTPTTQTPDPIRRTKLPPEAAPGPAPILKIFQFPADRIPRIDGDPADWSLVPDSYAITLADMHDDEHKHLAPDPKQLSIRVKIGWVKGLNRLFFLYEAFDQYWDFADPGLHNDTFEVVVDGDRSGGPLVPAFRNLATQSEAEARQMHGVTAQNYHIFTPSEGKEWALAWGCQPWIKDLPYANHAQHYTFRPGQPGNYTLEFFITPFDYAGCEGPQRAVESVLSEDKLIGLSFAVIDYDGKPSNNGFWNLGLEHTMYGNASLLRTFRLMPLEPALRPALDPRWTFQILDPTRRLVAFQDHSTSTSPITSWLWDFGDGTSSPDQHPLHTYAKPGPYVVVLTLHTATTTARLSKIWDVTLP